MKKSILEYLEGHSKYNPNKIAVIDQHTRYSYIELELLSKRIGSAICKLSQISKPIGVMLEKGANTLAAFLGVVQAGCFYSLINPYFPVKRLTQLQAVLQTDVIITDKTHLQFAQQLPGKQQILLIEDLFNHPIEEAALEAIRNQMIDNDPLYVNFTSGSTGTPKGVTVSHRSVIDFIEQFVPLFSIDETDIIGNQAPFDFDVSVKDIYSSLKTGATLVIIPMELFSSPAPLLDFICSHKITTLIWAVSALCIISTCHGFSYRVPDTIKRVLFSGEVMPQKHLREWLTNLPDTTFVNLYGPTEITCNCTYHIIDRDREYSDGLPIGKAFPNEHIFLLDEDNKEITTANIVGELCIRSSELALGYYNNPAQTEAVFVDNPLNNSYPEKIYRTGDLAKYSTDNELYFCGRKDFQIKYMGHRIELEEVERAISNIPKIERCCVVFDEKRQRLYGFYIGEIDNTDLYTSLTEQIPSFMIPGSLQKLDFFPLTKNGKIDRAKLLERK